MENHYSARESKSTPAVLLVFDRGLDSLPAIVPNGGDEQIDQRLIDWIESKLLAIPSRERRAAA